MAESKKTRVYVLICEHFSGAVSEVLGVTADLEYAKTIQREFSSYNRISISIYSTDMIVKPVDKKKKKDVKNG